MHGLVPRLLLVVDVNRRIAGSGVGATARGGVHDLACARGIEAGGARLSTLAGRVFALRIVVVALSRGVSILRIVAVARIVAIGVIVMVAAGLGVGRVAAVIACGAGRGVIPVPLAVLRFGQAVVGLLDGDAVPGLGVGRELEARIAQQSVGDQLRGTLPARRLRSGRVPDLA